jgi:hypothetical protein
MVAPSTSLAESQHAQSGLLTQVKNCIRFDGLVRIAPRKAVFGYNSIALVILGRARRDRKPYMVAYRCRTSRE